MAKVWFSVIVLLFTKNVLAYDCDGGSEISSCDNCIRCGGTWCSQRTDEHCTFTKTDVFCGGTPEVLTEIDFVSKGGVTIHPGYVERTLRIDSSDSFKLEYSSPVERKVYRDIYNQTQNSGYITVEPSEVRCTKGQCSLTINAKVQPQFCTNHGSTHEFVYVKIKVENMTEEAVIKYHVPCACECSKHVEMKSPKCSGQGDLSCGVCKCHDGWSGEYCDISDCGDNRGDVQCKSPLNDLECSGNGVCGHCDTCVCYNDREGSQYFDRTKYCSDICMDTSYCGQCLTNGTLGPCTESQDLECGNPMTVLAFNETIAAERDNYDRKIWIRCNDSFLVGQDEKCNVEYVAMKSEDGRIHVMVDKHCNTHLFLNPEKRTSTQVPLILGVLGAIAAVAALGGVMLWKHLSAVPPMPFSSPDYQNIDAEDCVGENPLYKPPTTTFTNPQFGKC